MKILYGFLLFLGLSSYSQSRLRNCICESGPPGRAGRNGNNGSKGEKGALGLRGDKGVAGAVGPQGATGIKGIRGMDGSNRGPKGAIGPPGPDTPCPDQCLNDNGIGRSSLRVFAGRSLNSYKPHTIYKVTAEGEMVAVKQLKPTPALRELTEYLKIKLK